MVIDICYYPFRHIPYIINFLKLLYMFIFISLNMYHISHVMNDYFHTIQLVLFVVQFVFLNTSFLYLNVPVLLFL